MENKMTAKVAIFWAKKDFPDVPCWNNHLGFS
jgi:hypothetical protein